MNKTEKSSRTLLGSGAFLRGSLCTQSCFESSLNCQIVFANNQRGVPALGQDLGLFHLGGIGRAVLLEELQPLIHMSSEGGRGGVHVRGVFYRDDRNLLRGLRGGIGQ